MGYILATIRLILMIILMLVVVGTGVTALSLKLAKQNFGFKMREIFCKVARIILGIKVIQTGNIFIKPGTLYIGNHRTLIDPVMIFSYIPNAYAVSKAEVASYPIVGPGARMSGVIFVDRKDKTSRNNAKSSITNALAQNNSVVVFPESTIGKARHTLPFKKGALEAALDCNQMVVPFAMEFHDPDRDFWHHDLMLKQFYTTFTKWNTKVSIHFFDAQSDTDPIALTEKCEKMINLKINEFQEKYWAIEIIEKYNNISV